MTTENDEWRPRNQYYENSQNEDGQKERKTYQSYGRSNYGNSGGGYRKPDNYDRQQGNFNRPKPSYNPQGNSNYNRQGNSNYNQQGNSNYNRQGNSSYNQSGGGNNYNRQGNSGYNQQGGNYNNSWGNSYDSRGNDYNPKPQRSSYDNYSRQYDNSQRGYNDNRQQNYQDNSSPEKKRRPRVGEAAPQARGGNYYQNAQGPAGNYNRSPQGGFQRQQRPSGKQFNRGPQGNFNAQKQDSKYSLKKQLKYREEHFDLDEPIRLNKFLSNSGVCSRREADEFIKAGLVKVNGETVNELGVKVKRSDAITFHNEPVKMEHKVYVLLNKPKNCVTTADDPQERLTVMDLVKNACQERIVPVGRLDRNTTGVLLLTNDGDLASKLTHPKFLKKKIYHVWLDKDISIEDMQKLADGIELEDGEIHADAVSFVNDTDKDQLGIEIHSGRNRLVRRMLESLGYHVVKLDRVYFAGLTKKNLKRGQWRYLNDKEVSMLRMGAFD